MAQYTIHTASSRGYANHGWLKSYHTFSFAGYFNPERVHFGALRVLNDDFVAAGMGFGKHPHENMEIVSIPLEGQLAHEDSTGSKGIIKKGEIQFMSAGSGVQHSEMNASATEAVKFLQIWVIPNKTNIEPCYGQISYEVNDNEIKTLIQPNVEEGTLNLQQNAWFKLAKFNADKIFSIPVEDPINNGIYLFLLKGAIEVDGRKLTTRDAIGVWEANKIEIKTNEQSEFLIIEVPMNLN
ncbi:MAG TPA: pirin family protein [Flavobacterium sp.]|nr:pirin family protein [Flavobacterium sp.]